MTAALVSEPLFGGRYQTATVRWVRHDYSAAGWTFVTVCTATRAPSFGTVVDGVVRLSDVGLIVDETFRAIPDHEAHVAVDSLVVMPDHVHVLIGLLHQPDAEETRHRTSLRAHPSPHTVETRHGASPPTSGPPPTADLVSRPHASSASPGWIPPAAHLVTPRVFGGLTAGSVSSIVNQTKGAVTRATRRAGHAGFRWQPRYHDRVVRSDRELDHVRRYIADNPARWTAR